MNCHKFIHYRPATVNDVHAITHVHTESWRHAYRNILTDDFLDHQLFDDHWAIWQERLATPPDNLFVLTAYQKRGHEHETNGPMHTHIEGFISVFGDHDPIWGSVVNNLHVLPAMHGVGIGKELIRQAMVWLATHYPTTAIQLEVFADNQPAQGFYEHLGGVVGEHFTETLPDGGTAQSLRYVWPDAESLLQAIGT